MRHPKYQSLYFDYYDKSTQSMTIPYSIAVFDKILIKVKNSPTFITSIKVPYSKLHKNDKVRFRHDKYFVYKRLAEDPICDDLNKVVTIILK